MTRAGDGTLVRVDLASGACAVEPRPEAMRRREAGGGLLGTRLLLDEVPAGLDALDPRQLLVFASGIVAGHRTIALPRFSVVGKSPLSGGIGEARVEGPFGPALRDSGHDAVVLARRAPVPSYVLVEHGRARVVGAPELWGLDTGEVTDVLSERHGRTAHVAAIGPAGEELVRFASIVSDRGFAASRMGLGAVMGSKKLKALVLVGGEERPPADASAVAALHAAYVERLPRNPLAASQHDPPGFGAWPAAGLEGYLGIENYRTAAPGDLSAFAPERFMERLFESHGACPGCPQHCMKSFRSGQADARAGVLHQEAVAAFAGNLGLRDLDAVLELNARCHLWGVDQVGLSFTLSFLCELSERGLLPAGALAGCGARFGDAGGLFALAEDIVRRRGAGEWLADGVRAASAWLGPATAPYAMCSKGVEIGSFDPRGSHGQALAYAVSPLGPRYDIVEHDIDFDPQWGRPEFIERALELGGRPGGAPMESLDEEKVRLVHNLLELWSAYDALGVCIFAAPPTRCLEPGEVARLVGAVTGWDVSEDELLGWGRKRLELMRLYNVREGLTDAADALPDRFFDLPLDTGRLRGAALDRPTFERSRDQLYGLLGWRAVT